MFLLTFSHTYSPWEYVDMIHKEYLLKICNEAGSSLQGLKYEGGPKHMCEMTHLPVMLPYVHFPEVEKTEHLKCIECLKPYHDIDLILGTTVTSSCTLSKS